jgi:hypothetical protein
MEIGSEKFREKRNLNCQIENMVWPGEVDTIIYDLQTAGWQTQLESQQRLALYNEWLPQMHVDVHEMGYNSPYFFHPAEPCMNILRNKKRFELSRKLQVMLMLNNTRER